MKRRPRRPAVLEQTAAGWRKVRVRVPEPRRGSSERVPRPPELRSVPRVRLREDLARDMRSVALVLGAVEVAGELGVALGAMVRRHLKRKAK